MPTAASGDSASPGRAGVASPKGSCSARGMLSGSSESDRRISPLSRPPSEGAAERVRVEEARQRARRQPVRRLGNRAEEVLCPKHAVRQQVVPGLLLDGDELAEVALELDLDRRFVGAAAVEIARRLDERLGAGIDARYVRLQASSPLRKESSRLGRRELSDCGVATLLEPARNADALADPERVTPADRLGAAPAGATALEPVERADQLVEHLPPSVVRLCRYAS